MSAAGPSQGTNAPPGGQHSGVSRKRGDHMSAAGPFMDIAPFAAARF